MRSAFASVLMVLTAQLAASAMGAGAGGAQMAPRQVATAAPPSSPHSDLVAADSLYRAMDAEGAMEVIRARLAVVPDDFEATWRGAAVVLSLGIVARDRAVRLGWLRAAAAFGDQLLAQRPHDVVSLTWAAATKGRLALEERNPMRTAGLGKEAWALTELLLAADPGHPMGNAVRGKLVQEVRRLSRAERVLARLLLGGEIAGATAWSDSERHLERAVAADPGMVLYHLDLGDTYRLQGKSGRALETYTRGLALPDNLPVDPYFKRRILDGVRELSLPEGGEAVTGGAPSGG